jgi:predicted RNase H-like nuclease (RuvC/YqgF family)
MKKTIFSIAVVVFMAVTMLTGCQQSSNKVDNAKDNVQDAKENLIDANQKLSQALSDSIEQFRRDAGTKIADNETSIATMKAKLSAMSEANRVRFEKQINTLEQKNSEMKKKLADYRDEGDVKWISFKNEFNHDMDELGKAFKDMTTNNF